MIAVIGGRGVIGDAIVETLRSQGRKVVVVTHDPMQALADGFRHGDLLDYNSLVRALQGTTTVVQSVNFYTYPIEKPRRGHTYQNFDARGTERSVAAARESGAARYVFISGVGAAPDSPRPYFKAISHGEHAVRNSGLEAVCIRPTLVYGPRDRGLNRILELARKSPVLPVIGGNQEHQPVYVNDVASIVSRVVDPGAPQGTFEVGGPERMSLDRVIKTLFEIIGLRRTLLYVPTGVARMGAAALQFLPGPPLTPSAVDFLAEDFVADVDRVVNTFKIRLTPFKEGLGKYLKADA